MNNRDKDEMVKRKQVCWFYKYRECKFGKNCSYWHPPGVRQKDRDRYRDRLFESRDYGRSVNGYPMTQMGINIKICTIMGVTRAQEVINIHRGVLQAKNKIKVHIF